VRPHASFRPLYRCAEHSVGACIGWLNKVSKTGGLISEEDLKKEREREEAEKKAKREWEYKQKEAGRTPTHIPRPTPLLAAF
jgi:hypothetical protein